VINKKGKKGGCMWYAMDKTGKFITVSLEREKEDAFHNLTKRLTGARFEEWKESGFLMEQANPPSAMDGIYTEYIVQIAERNKKKCIKLDGDIFQDVWGNENLRNPKNFIPGIPKRRQLFPKKQEV
jgi:hypothetical protein